MQSTEYLSLHREDKDKLCVFSYAKLIPNFILNITHTAIIICTGLILIILMKIQQDPYV